MSLDKVLQLAGAVAEPPDPDAELLLAVQLAARELTVLLADSGDDDEGDGKDDGDGGGHTDHPTYKALVKKNVPADRAATMCAKADKRVKASQLAQALEVMLSGRPGIDIGLVTLTPDIETAGGRRKAAASDHALPDGSYSIEDKAQLHKAAVLAASKHGDWKAALTLIRHCARDFGVNVRSLPGFGGTDGDGERAAASMLSLAKAATGDGGIPMNHGPFTGKHTHTHFQSGAHAHEHQHVNDNSHHGGPLHRPGSEPSRDW